MKRPTEQKSQDIVPPIVEKVPQSIEQQMLAEAIATFEMFKKDETALDTAIKSRNEQLTTLQQEQRQDFEHLLRVRGALSALQHIVTTYKSKLAGLKA